LRRARTESKKGKTTRGKEQGTSAGATCCTTRPLGEKCTIKDNRQKAPGGEMRPVKRKESLRKRIPMPRRRETKKRKGGEWKILLGSHYEGGEKGKTAWGKGSGGQGGGKRGIGGHLGGGRKKKRGIGRKTTREERRCKQSEELSPGIFEKGGREEETEGRGGVRGRFAAET